MYSLLSDIGYKGAVTKTAIGAGYTWSDASNVAICGIVIVFLMLVLLVISIAVFGKIMDSVNGTAKPKTPKAPKVPKKDVPKSAPVDSGVINSSDTDEGVIAAIAAAVGYLYSGSDVKPVIRAIKPTNNKSQRSAWANAGIIQNTRAF